MAVAAKKWVSKVKTVSTHPPEGLFTKDAETIARQLASKRAQRRDLDRGCGCSRTSSIGRARGSVFRAGRNLRKRRSFFPCA
jgi:hypothetical protein